MKIADRAFGPFLALFGLLVIWGASRLPKVPGVRYGAEILPTIIGVTLLILGALVLIKGLKNRDPLFDISDWRGQPRENLAALWSVLGLLLGMLLFKPLGFPIFGTVFMAVMMALMGARWRMIVLVAPSFVFLLYFIFTGVLRVSLPAGPLEAFLL